MSQYPDSSPERVEELRRKYGDAALAGAVRGFVERVRALAILGDRIAAVNQEGDVPQYEKLVENIIESTQEYYAFMGRIPGELRRFLLEMQTLQRNVGGTVKSSSLRDLLGYEAGFDDLPAFSIQAIRPKKYVMQIDAVTSQLSLLDGQTEIQVGQQGSKPILTAVTLDMPDHMRIEGGGILTSYDKSIINGVTSLLESGNTVFSIPMLYHAMTGKQNPTVDGALYEELAGKLEKMRRMMLSIDLSQENEALLLTGEEGSMKVQNLTLDGYLLPLNRITGMINGKRSELYQIIQAPPLYTYSKMKRQMASVRLSLLSAPINNNTTTIPLRTYLLQCVEGMREDPAGEKTGIILYESIYRELGESDAGKVRKKRIRGYVTAILDHFLEQNYIGGYCEFRGGRSILGLRLTSAPPSRDEGR